MPARAIEGFLHGDVPFLRVGDGPPLVSILGLTPEHDLPRGLDRRLALGRVLPLAGHFTVYVVNLPRGLRPGETMHDVASRLAGAIEHDIGGPVHLDGTSTGGSVALQLAVDHPDLVRRLVVIASAYRLGQEARTMQRQAIDLIRAGQPREAWTRVITSMAPPPLRLPLSPVARGVAGRMVPEDTTDLLVTLEAEDAFDVGEDLSRVSSPTLVIGGGKDRFYASRLFAETAAGVVDGRVHLFPSWGHGRTAASSATTHLELGFLLAA